MNKSPREKVWTLEFDFHFSLLSSLPHSVSLQLTLQDNAWTTHRTPHDMQSIFTYVKKFEQHSEAERCIMAFTFFFFFLNTLNWKCTKIVITCCVHRSNTQILETCRAKSYGMWAQGACSGISLLSAAQMRASTRLSTSGPMCGPLSLCHLAATLILVITVRAQVLSILCTDIVPRKQSPRWVWMVNPC